MAYERDMRRGFTGYSNQPGWQHYSMYRPQTTTLRQESEMASKSLHELEATGNLEDPVERIRLLCLSHGANGILRLGRMFRRMDKSGDENLNFGEFLAGLRKSGLGITDDEAKKTFEKFDNDGRVNIEEFLLHIRPPLSESRKKVIEEAFQKLDKFGDGEVTVEDLKHAYNVKSQPRYISGEDSEESILKQFLDNFEQDATDGLVTKEDFFNYYSAVSASIDNDGYFDLMMRQTYKFFTGYSDQSILQHHRPQSLTSRQEFDMATKSLDELEATDNSEDPVQRLRLLCLSHGATGILRLGRLFKRLDQSGNQNLSFDEFFLGLQEIGLEITGEEAKNMFERFDSNGRVDIEEFLIHIRPPLSESRKKVIEEAFQKLDKFGDGEITIEDLKHAYNVKSQARYISGADSEESILKEFLENFEQHTTRDGIVTKEDFINYYAVISASIDNDCYFDLMMRQAYKFVTGYSNQPALQHHRPQSVTSRQEFEMAAKSLDELEATGNLEDPIERLRLLCLSHGATGILRLGRLFRRLDGGGKKNLNFHEFVLGLQEIGLEITGDEAKSMFEKFDIDGNGSFNVEEFLEYVRPPLSESREKVIEDAFHKIDKSGKGEITIDELKRVYNVNSQPRYISGEESRESILKEFLGNFEQDTTKNIIVTKEEFFNYYAAISTSVDNDGYFDLMMRQAYKL